MYFRLNPECYYIKGDLTGAIYDLIEGDVYALSPQESRTIEACENNGIVDRGNPFLCELKSRTLGNFYEKKVFIEKLRLGSPIEEYQRGKPPFLARAFLELGNSCDRSCWFCGYSGVSRSMGCLGCNIWNEEGTPVDIIRWKELIDELHRLQCQSLFIKGGDLTTEWEKIQTILEYAHSRFEKIFVIGHKAHFSPENIDYLENRANLIIQTTKLSDIDDRHIYLLITNYQEFRELPEKTSGNVIVDIVSRNYYPQQPDSPLNSRRKINKTSLEQFKHYNNLHPCLAHSVTITWKGEVLPCPMMRNHSLGNMKERKLWTFFKGTQESIQEFWKISLNTLKKCSACEFRYVCTDCRALEATKTGDLHSKVLCNYDPSKGTWQQPAA